MAMVVVQGREGERREMNRMRRCSGVGGRGMGRLRGIDDVK